MINILSLLVFIVICIGTLIPINTLRASSIEGAIEKMWIHNFDPKVLFKLSNLANDMPDCAKTKKYAISTDTLPGKNILSTLLEARDSSKKIQVVGTNACTTHHDAETVKYVVLKPNVMTSGQNHCVQNNNSVGFVGLDSSYGTVYVKVTGHKNECGCNYFRFKPDTTDTQKALSILLSARLSNQPVRIDAAIKNDCNSAYRVYIQ